MSGWEDYESGPFCRHWGDPSDCDNECATCHHYCYQHGQSEGDFACNECECEKWAEEETEDK